MNWFSFLKKNKPETTPEQSELHSSFEDVPVKTRGRGKAKDNPVDPALPEKKRARRRLVGAVAMTLALVIVLPMVLDAEPKSVSEDIVIHIPSRNKPSRPSVPLPDAAASVASVAPEKVEPSAQAGASVQKTIASKGAEQTVAKAAAEKTVTEKSAEAPAKTDKAKEKKDDKPVATETKSKYMIQVAALASADKVKDLRARLKKAGFKSVTQKVETSDGERIRVRVGPYAGKKEAEKACPKLNKMKLKCTLVSN